MSMADYDEQDWWALEHADQILKIAVVVCQVNTHPGKTPCAECIKSARKFFVSATYRR